MQLKTFDKTIQAADKGRGTCALVLPRAGSVCKLSAAAVVALGLRPGDKVAVHQDVDNPSDWYVEPKPAEKGLPLRVIGLKTNACTLLFNSKNVAQSMRKALGFYSGGAMRVPLGLEPQTHDGRTLYPLITHAAKESTRPARFAELHA